MLLAGIQKKSLHPHYSLGWGKFFAGLSGGSLKPHQPEDFRGMISLNDTQCALLSKTYCALPSFGVFFCRRLLWKMINRLNQLL
jgi:hypothetical protein